MNRKGFTLVEILIAISLFALASVIASNILVDTIRLQEKVAIETELYSDVQFILQRLSDEISNGTIDYEQYYSAEVVQTLDPGPNGVLYGVNNGVYGSRFYDPGRRRDVGTPGINPADLGTECSVFSDDGQSCDVVWTHSADLNTGHFPYIGSGDDGNAFCDEGAGDYCDQIVGNKVTVNELYLIDESGAMKTILARKLIAGNDYALGLLRMEGRDLDQNGVIDVFSCMEEFECFDEAADVQDEILYPFIQDEDANFITQSGIRVGQADDLNVALNVNATQFVPISPLRSSIKDLKFIVRPLEDPNKAYAEVLQQVHPTVTIVMTVGLSEATAADYPGEFQDITVQTTVATGVNAEVNTYPPVTDKLRAVGSNERSWVWDVLSPAGLD